MECAFRTAADGRLRCLPYVTAVGGLLYVDPVCTQPIYGEPPGGCGAPKWASPGPSGGPVTCSPPPGPAMFRVGSALTAQPTAVYQDNYGSCVLAFGAGYTYYAATEEPASAFVAATEQVE